MSDFFAGWKNKPSEKKSLRTTTCIINGWFSPTYENPRGFSSRFLFAKLGAWSTPLIIHKNVGIHLMKKAHKSYCLKNKKYRVRRKNKGTIGFMNNTDLDLFNKQNTDSNQELFEFYPYTPYLFHRLRFKILKHTPINPIHRLSIPSRWNLLMVILMILTIIIMIILK